MFCGALNLMYDLSRKQVHIPLGEFKGLDQPLM